MALCVDLVLNHTAREHQWARRALAGEPGYREMYLIYPDRTEPDAYERTLPEVFPDIAPGSFTQVPGLGWVWTSFHEYQWDLNYANPAVFRAMLGTMLVLANRGIDVLRLDAVLSRVRCAHPLAGDRGTNTDRGPVAWPSPSPGGEVHI